MYGNVLVTATAGNATGLYLYLRAAGAPYADVTGTI